MKLEKLIKTLDAAVSTGVPIDCDIKEIKTQSVDDYVEAITITVQPDRESGKWYQIHTSWQTK